MPHVNPTLPDNGENADAEDISVPFLALLAIFNGHIAADNIETGSMPWSIMDNFTDSIPASAMRDSANLELFRRDVLSDFVADGCVWSSLTGRNGAMTEGVVYVSGIRMDINAIASKTFTASKDTYISISSSGSVGYTEVNNGAAAPSLTSNSIWVAVVKTNATTITSVVQNNTVTSAGDTVYRSGPIGASSQGDTGWINISVTAPFTQLSPGERPQIRKIGAIVYARGGWSNTNMAINNTHVVGLIPLGYRPDQNVIARAGTDHGNRSASMFVSANGEVSIRCSDTLSSYYKFGGQSWIAAQ